MTRKWSALRNLRRARTLNQEQMARLLRVAQQTYSKYEAGVIVPPADRQAQIAAILGTSVDALWPTVEQGHRSAVAAPAPRKSRGEGSREGAAVV